MTAARVSLAVLGAGSWGTALAACLARSGHRVRLWGRDPLQIAALERTRINARYLPGVVLPEGLAFTADLGAALEGAQASLVVVPTGAFRGLLRELAALAPGRALVWASKGIEAGSGKLMHTLIEEELRPAPAHALISGPTFAAEVVRALPAALSVASPRLEFATRVAGWLHGETLRAYPNDDLIGVELGGALKNVLAIAAGIADGLGFGANSRAALITRGLAELMRLGLARGGRAETFMGLAGLGDLVLTCTDDLSRNRRLGLLLAEGLDTEAALQRIGQAVEGVKTAREAWRMAAESEVEMPITEQVYRVLYEGLAPRRAVHNLLSRDLRRE